MDSVMVALNALPDAMPGMFRNLAIIYVFLATVMYIVCKVLYPRASKKASR